MPGEEIPVINEKFVTFLQDWMPCDVYEQPVLLILGKQ